MSGALSAWALEYSDLLPGLIGCIVLLLLGVSLKAISVALSDKNEEE